ncbi:MAG: DUF992 domain-containing protein [Xanthobacteraceae bacterium]
MVRTGLLRTFFWVAAGIAAATFAALSTEPADAQPARIQIGSLNCSLSSSVGLLLGSQRNVACILHTDSVPDESYAGTLTRVGLDIGATSGGKIVWAVFAGTNRFAGMLNGTYVGASGEASIGAGLGANVLIGGSNSSVALQPLSIQGQVGLNIAAGVSKLYLCEQGTNCPAP